MTRTVIIDNEEHIRLLLREELEDDGHEVIIIDPEDFGRLSELLENEDPDLVILDVELARHNGLDLLNDIRNKHYNLPVVVFSAYNFKEDERSRAANFCVTKSPILDELRKMIGRALNTKTPKLSEISGL